MATKTKEYFEELHIGEEFSHNNFKYRKVSKDFAVTLDDVVHREPKERFFNGPTRIKFDGK